MTSTKCCGVHVKSCAKIVAILGIVSSVLSFGSVIKTGTWWNLPLNILLIVAYSLVLYGISKEEPKFLMPAQIFLGINVVLSVICVLVLVILGIIIPVGLIHFLNPEDTSETGRQAVRIILFVMAFVYILVAAYTIFAFTVIRRARKYLLNF